ncbi:hypothetical protein OBBRIDRAFT_651207 [Obba rivulosa]|uniref:Uncharacterized protein n=1 Tax=Obba rivulosa TaxID=1052685 RepID=A0A8E2DK65_9APHY|nr:hypothetical protein OBBRIDRAFT_651207 [Obba rivulosa]
MPAILTRARPAHSSIGRALGPALTVLTLNESESQRDRAASPTSPRPLAESPFILKAVRAFEHDRQRAKRVAETARARERKARRGSTDKRRQHTARSAQSQGKSAGQKGNTRSWEADERMQQDLVLEASEESPRNPVLEISLAVPELVEVELSDLIKPGKAPKAKGTADFEVIPTVRQVIALEDGLPLDPEMDEPWEHISADDADDTLEPAPSYARIVANAA